MQQVQFVAIGEAMLEFGRHANQNADDKNYKLSFAGDTFNTLFYFQKYASLSNAESYYATALGDDVMSEEMLSCWNDYNIKTSLVAKIPGKLPGLYVISLDDNGERKFLYYRDNAAAKDFCSSAEFSEFSKKISKMKYIYLSGITLAIYSDDNREKLFSMLRDAKNNGAEIIFDTNFRPALWQDKSQAQTVIEKFYPLFSKVLPTFEDEQLLFGDAAPQDTIKRLRKYGIEEIVVKCGADGCLVADADKVVDLPVPQPITAVDTTAAGDSFNGSYLAMRAAGRSTGDAAMMAHKVAATVIQRYGALVHSGLPEAL